MGNFYGHLAPGVFFMIFGAWWTIQIWRKYFRTLTTKQGQDFRFRSELTSPVEIRGRRVNVEAILVVVFTIIGMLVEFRHIYLGGEIGIGRTQHGTMYIFFLVLGIIGLFRQKLRRLLPSLVMDDIEYVLYAMALTVEALLFDFHLMERDVLDTTIHVLLVYAIYGGILVTLAELAFRNQVLLAQGRAFFLLLQGTWFCQVGFILYSPVLSKSGVYNTKWDHADHEHTMFATCIYTWHIGGVFLFSLLCGCLCACFHRRRFGAAEFQDLTLGKDPEGRNGYAHQHLLSAHQEDDDDDDDDLDNVDVTTVGSK